MAKSKKEKYAIASLWKRSSKHGEFWSGSTNPEYFKDYLKGLKLLATAGDKYELFLSVKTDKASEKSPDATLFVQEKFQPKAASKKEEKEDTPW